MPELELYFSPGSCSRVPLITLEEIGEPFETHLVKRALMEHRSPEYLALNPKGKVPTLVIDGRPLTENPAIAAYLSRTYPAARLLPTGDIDLEIDVLSTMAWFASGIHPLIGRLRRPQTVCDVPEALPRVRELACAGLVEAFGLLDEWLADREWLFADWSIVDAYLYWLWFRATGSGMDGTPFAHCAAHARRIEQRPSVERALAREAQAIALLEREGLGAGPPVDAPKPARSR